MGANRRKIYVLDTTVLIENPDIMYELGDADVVFPLAVIKEIDGLKNNTEEMVAQAARKIGRDLDRLGSYGNLINGVKLSSGSVLRVCTQYDIVEGLSSEEDNKIVGTALKIERETGHNVVLLTTDMNMRTVARAYGLKSESPALCAAMHDNSGEGFQRGGVRLRTPDSNQERQVPNSKRRSKLFIYLRAFYRCLMPKKLKIFLLLFSIVTALLYSLTKVPIEGAMVCAFAVTAVIFMALYPESDRRRRYINGYSSPECAFMDGNIYHSSDDHLN